jgi:hypothetical protein
VAKYGNMWQNSDEIHGKTWQNVKTKSKTFLTKKRKKNYQKLLQMVDYHRAPSEILYDSMGTSVNGEFPSHV